MKMKTIKAPISLVLKPGEDPVPPGTKVSLTEAEADSLIARFGAVEIDEDDDEEAEGKGAPKKGSSKKASDGQANNDQSGQGQGPTT